MKLSFRKERPLDRSRVEFRDSKIFVIATEGSITEPQYFRLFHTTKIQIEILPTHDGKSSPESVIERLIEYKRNYDLDKDDQLYLVIDRDRWQPAQLNQVAKKCQDHGFVFAVSNPCFEYWLYLHLKDPDIEFNICKEVADKIREINGEYNKKNLKSEFFPKRSVQEAIDRAKNQHTNLSDRWPQKNGSFVYQVMEKILTYIK